MAIGRIKTEMGKRNGRGRWMRRALAKRYANKMRRRTDCAEAQQAGDLR